MDRTTPRLVGQRNEAFEALRGVLCIALLGASSVGCSGRGTRAPAATGGAGAVAANSGGAAAPGTGGGAGTQGAPDGGSGGANGIGSGGAPDAADASSDAAVSAEGGRGGAGGSGGTATLGDLSGGIEWEPWPTVDRAPADTCVVSQLHGGDRSSPPTLVRTETWRYDATTRILTRNGSTVGYPATVAYTRFDAQGRREMICDFDRELMCLEWTRDPAGNATGYAYYGVKEGPVDERALDPAHPPIRTSTSRGGAESERHTVAYDPSGLISSGTYYYPQRGAILSFTRDSADRCSDVTWTMPQSQLVEVDHWTHLGNKLVSRTVTMANEPTNVRAVITYAYDADGALAATTVDGRLDFPDAPSAPMPPHDGVVDYVLRTSKQSDGSRWVETLDFQLSGTRNNARVMRQGKSADALRMRWHLSPACEALSLPRHTSQGCEFERPLPSRPSLGWHNPLVTPIPGWAMAPMYD